MSTAERILQLPETASYQYPIYNCAGQAQGVKASACPGSWNNLGPGYVETVRKCAACGRNVYLSKDESQVRTYDSLKYAFVIDIDAIERERQQKTALPLKFSTLTHIDRRKKNQPDTSQMDVHSELENFRRRRQDAA